MLLQTVARIMIIPFFSLVNPDVLSELIGLIITEPSKELEESARFRLPHIAAEILSCEVPQINEQVSWKYQRIYGRVICNILLTLHESHFV